MYQRNLWRHPVDSMRTAPVLNPPLCNKAAFFLSFFPLQTEKCFIRISCDWPDFSEHVFMSRLKRLINTLEGERKKKKKKARESMSTPHFIKAERKRWRSGAAVIYCLSGISKEKH